MNEWSEGGHAALDHDRCDHSPDLNDLCATLYLLKRWPRPPGDAHLRYGRSPGAGPVVTEILDSQLIELNDLARRTLD
jgi:hypothetical protein